MAKVPLRGKYGEGLFAEVDEEDLARLLKFRWVVTKPGYAVRSRLGGLQFLHNEVLGISVPVKGTEPDHRNRNKLDNRKENLRIGTTSDNRRNVFRSDNSSGCKGVYRRNSRPNGNPWFVQIDGKYLGSFKTFAEAASAVPTERRN